MLHPGLITIALTLVCSFVLLILQKRKKKAKFIHLISNTEAPSSRPNIEQLREIAEKLDYILTNQKMYTNPELSIHDLAAIIGTNRSYVSSSINIFYNQNFCSYINQYRLNALKETIEEENYFTQKELAVKCGFGSIDTMKRTVKQKTGLTIKEWKEQLIHGKFEIDTNEFRKIKN
ncbi:MAG: AraC family transcriptional regulator [Paludibacter sp.]|nr:AraC family transcriptional regulator [Paludibacter sp.]